MSSPAEKKPMNTCVFKRTVFSEPLVIHLSIRADVASLDDSVADDIAHLVSQMDVSEDEVSLPALLAERIVNLFSHVQSVEVVDEDGDGAIITKEVRR